MTTSRQFFSELHAESTPVPVAGRELNLRRERYPSQTRPETRVVPSTSPWGNSCQSPPIANATDYRDPEEVLHGPESVSAKFALQRDFLVGAEATLLLVRYSPETAGGPAANSTAARSSPPSFRRETAWSPHRCCRTRGASTTALRKLPASAGNAAAEPPESTARPSAGKSPNPLADSISASLHSSTSPVRTHSAESPLSVCRRTPISGAVRPVRARQTISLPRRSAIAAPVAPVKACAFSAMMLMPGSRSNLSGVNQRMWHGRPAHDAAAACDGAAEKLAAAGSST